MLHYVVQGVLVIKCKKKKHIRKNKQTNKAKNKNPTFWTVSISKRKFAERGKNGYPSKQIHDHSLSCLGTGTSIKMAGLS